MSVSGKQIQPGSITSDRLEEPLDVDVHALQHDFHILLQAWVEIGLPLPPELEARFEGIHSSSFT
jgi:hypothetical protein